MPHTSLYIVISFILLGHAPLHSQSVKGGSDSVENHQWVKSFTGTESSDGVILKWELDSFAQSDSILIERSRDDHNFQSIALVSARQQAFTDYTAIFGEYYYRLKWQGVDHQVTSRSIPVESYAGGLNQSLYPESGVVSGTSINLVYGNAQKNDTIWIGLFKTNAIQLGDFMGLPLNNQMLQVKTDSLASGKYVLVSKLSDFPVNIHRFKIK